MGLNKEQQQKIGGYLNKFMSSVDFREEMDSREKRREFVVTLLSGEKLKSMTELEFGELISKLWASALWGDKDYLVQKIIDANGLDKIVNELENLLYGSESFDKRFDRFLKEIKGLGPATITEILLYFDTFLLTSKSEPVNFRTTTVKVQYYENRKEMDEKMAQDEKFIKLLKEQFPSRLYQKIHGQNQALSG